MASQLPTPLPVDTEPSRPTFKRNNSTPYPPQPSRETPPFTHRPSSTVVFPLKKRPSAFSLQNSSAPIPPSLPSPALPPRPRTGTMPDGPPPRPRKSSSRPSTASSREEVTPWEFQPSPFERVIPSPVDDKFERALTPTLKSKASSIKSGPPSVKSASAHQTSVRSRSSSTATGLVEDVTPWESYPPIPEKDFKYHNPTHKVLDYSTSGPSPQLATSTGLVEDVTPWELVPPPQEFLAKPLSRSSSHLASVDETSTLYSYDSNRPHNNRVPPPSAGSSSQFSLSSSAAFQEHKVQKTGRTEDVTPWELEPGPGSGLGQGDVDDTKQLTSARLRSSMSLAQVEEVTPWELHPSPSIPPPPPPIENIMKDMEESSVNDYATLKQKSSRSGISLSSSNGRASSDLSFAHGRRHTGKPSKTRQASGTHQAAKVHTQGTQLRIPEAGDEISRPAHPRTPDSPTTPRFLNRESTASNGALSASAVSVATRPVQHDTSAKLHFNFSTADRTILRQLRFFKDAHDKEFIIKGKGFHQQGGGVTPGKIHHAYQEKDAPYPRCYDSRAQDLDSWEIILYHQICNSWTWHIFEEEPKAVLDIGCGTGTWIAHVAGVWKECHFWGIDIVPTQPDFNTLGDRDLKERVHWVQENFLKGLPFEDEQFDYIHIKRVGLGVPENKWDALFEECNRVLKPGGALELIEEDLFFPGKANDSNELPSNTMAALDIDPSWSSSQAEAVSQDPPASQPSPSVVARDNTSLPTPSPSAPSSQASEFAKRVAFTNAEHSPDRNSQSASLTFDPTSSSSDAPRHTSLVPPHSRSAARPALSVKTPSGPQNSTSFTGSVVSLFGGLGADDASPSARRRRQSSGVVGVATDTYSSGLRSRADSSGLQSQASVESNPPQNNKQTKSEPYFLRQYKAPMNPRDHTILEAIYTEMLSSRFINMAPLSILQNYLEYHFSDVRTHAPLLYAFPPTSLLHSESRYVTDTESEPESSDEFSSDDEEARDAIRPKPPKAKIPKNPLSPASPPRSRYRCTPGKPADFEHDEVRFLSLSQLIRQQSPYVMFDRSRGYAFSPVSHPQRRSTDGKPSGPIRMSRLPNSTLNIDLKSLNMHLYLRTMDILGCSEPMWEWVIQYQREFEKKRGVNGSGTPVGAPGGIIRPMRSNASLNSATSLDSMHSVMNGIAEMTREDFEVLLSNFELDMQDQASLDYALQEQVSWHVFSSPRDLRRKAFDDSCKKWDKWVAKQERRARHIAQRQNHPKTGENGIHSTPPESLRKQSSRDLLSTPTSEVLNDNTPKPELSQPSFIPFSTSSLPPYKRISRAIRVYVAWKDRNPTSPAQAATTSNGVDTPNASNSYRG